MDQVAELTQTKRTEAIKNALAVYHWFVRQAITGARVVARKPTGEEVALETPEPAALEGKGHRLQSRKIPARQPELLARRLDTGPEVSEGEWFKRIPGMTVCGEGELIRTFLLPGPHPKGRPVA